MITIGISILLLGIIVMYVTQALPNIPAEQIHVEPTPERVKRGEYLANHVAVCIDCHSTRDWDKFSGPPKPGTLGMGGDIFDERYGFPGKYIVPNITPYGLKGWSDGEILRAFTCGVGKNNRPLFPIMPYQNYSRVDKEDMLCIIAYLKTLTPIESHQPVSSSNFPMNIIIHTLPRKSAFVSKPDTNNRVAYGEYMTTMAGCIDCHTPFERGKLVKEKAFGGGRVFDFEFMTLTSPNITFDIKTGIGNWTKDYFIYRFKAFDPDSFPTPNVKKDDFNTIMPWTQYAGMTESDLSAIYEYLKSLKPIENKTELVVFKKKKKPS